MKVTYSDKARQWEKERQLLQNATRRLEEILGRSADSVVAEWDRTEDAHKRLQYVLTLRDSTEEAQATFSPEALNFDDYVRARLYHLWGDILQVRSERQHRKVQEMVDQLGGS